MLFKNSNNENNERKGDLKMENKEMNSMEELTKVLEGILENLNNTKEDKENKVTMSEEERKRARDGAEQLLDNCEAVIMSTDIGCFVCGSKINVMFALASLIERLFKINAINMKDLEKCIEWALKQVNESEDE